MPRTPAPGHVSNLMNADRYAPERSGSGHELSEGIPAPVGALNDDPAAHQPGDGVARETQLSQDLLAVLTLSGGAGRDLWGTLIELHRSGYQRSFWLRRVVQDVFVGDDLRVRGDLRRRLHDRPRDVLPGERARICSAVNDPMAERSAESTA